MITTDTLVPAGPVVPAAPPRTRAALLRHSGYSYTEIAATLGIAVGSVGVLLARAESAFRVHYRRLEEEK